MPSYWGSSFPSTFACVPLFPQLSVLALCFTRMLLPFPLFPNVFWLCSPIGIEHVPLFPTLLYDLGSLDKYDFLRSTCLVYAITICPLCDLLIFAWAHFRFVPEITSKMTRCSVRPTRIQISVWRRRSASVVLDLKLAWSNQGYTKSLHAPTVSKSLLKDTS